jgi:hypothetical protein
MNEKQFEQLLDALCEINESIGELTYQVKGLGLNGADTKMGALELVANEVRLLKESFQEANDLN